MNKIVDIKAKVVELLIVCPLLKRQNNCPMNHTDKMVLLNRFKWMHEQSSHRLQGYLDYHEFCYRSRCVEKDLMADYRMKSIKNQEIKS